MPNGLLSVETKPRQAVGEQHSNRSRASRTWPAPVSVRVTGWVCADRGHLRCDGVNIKELKTKNTGLGPIYIRGCDHKGLYNGDECGNITLQVNVSSCKLLKKMVFSNHLFVWPCDWTFPKDVTEDLSNHERVASWRRGRREEGVLILHPIPIMTGWSVTAIASLSPD